MISNIYKRLKEISEKEFFDIVIDAEIIYTYSGRARKLRIHLIDETFIDVWYSTEGEYSYHWEQREVRDSIYRHDNAPHQKWANVNTFPKHCHNMEESTVMESNISDNPEKAIREFITIVREKLVKLKFPST